MGPPLEEGRPNEPYHCIEKDVACLFRLVRVDAWVVSAINMPHLSLRTEQFHIECTKTCSEHIVPSPLVFGCVFQHFYFFGVAESLTHLDTLHCSVLSSLAITPYYISLFNAWLKYNISGLVVTTYKSHLVKRG